MAAGRGGVRGGDSEVSKREGEEQVEREGSVDGREERRRRKDGKEEARERQVRVRLKARHPPHALFNSLPSFWTWIFFFHLKNI